MSASKTNGQKWLAAQLGITQQRVSTLVSESRIPRKVRYTAADVVAAKSVLRAARASANATVAGSVDDDSDAAIRALSKNPEKIARIKLVVERTAKIKLERELLAGVYIKREEAEKENVARVYSVRAKMQEVPLRAALLVGKSEREIECTLTEWMKEVCDYYANGGN